MSGDIESCWVISFILLVGFIIFFCFDVDDNFFSFDVVTLPLWNPTIIELGAVGYLSKLTGTFVTLFTAMRPEKSSNPAVQGMPSLYGYGHVKKGTQRADERNVAQRGLDAFVGLLTFRGRGGGSVSCVEFSSAFAPWR
jgi:hypothetical protein